MLFTQLTGLTPEGVAALTASYGTIVLEPLISAGLKGL